MKVLLLAPVFAMVAIGLVYGDDVYRGSRDNCKIARDVLTIEACEKPPPTYTWVTLFTTHYVASIIEEVA